MINVLEHNVVADGTTQNTTALQNLVDRTAAGTLMFPPGDYLTGGLVLHGNLTLHLEAGATVLGSTAVEDYTHHDPPPETFHEGAQGMRALLFAVDAENITITGQGTIDGQGGSFHAPPGMRAGRPRNIWFARCRNVTVENISLRNSAFWMQHYMKCEQLRLLNLDVWNHGGSNNDGIDVDCCRDVVISGCRVDSADDAICLKAGNDTPTENVLVSNCITRSHCNHFKCGTESNCGFRNIRADGLVMVASEHQDSHGGTEGADYRGACGIGLGAVDGGFLENITVTNVTMDGVRVPFFVRLGDRGRPHVVGGPHQPLGYARNITLRNINARNASSQGCYVVGLPEEHIQDVTIAESDLQFEGGGTEDLIDREVPQNREGYPSMEMFGTLPAYGIYSRDVDGLRVENVRLTTITPDARPATKSE